MPNTFCSRYSTGHQAKPAEFEFLRDTIRFLYKNLLDLTVIQEILKRFYDGFDVFCSISSSFNFYLHMFEAVDSLLDLDEETMS